MSSSSTVSTFSDLALDQEILQTLAKNRMVTPTPIQQKAIPVVLTGKDLIGIAQTGTGKTFAFGLPTLHRLQTLKGKALVIVPTRELAFQVEESLKSYSHVMKIMSVCLIGGAPMGGQKQMLAKKPRLIIATPGRLIDHLEQRTVNLQDVEVLILDEADRMFDMGFAPQIQRIVEHVGKDRQTLLFSATMPAPIAKLATRHMINPQRIEIASAGTVADKVEQGVYVVKKFEKTALLATLLSQSFGTALVFTRTKYGAKNLTTVIKHLGYSAAEIHSNRSLGQRRQALEGFKSGRYRVLIATDIAARGIDVAGIELVVNFDLPENPEDYVHRIGRTARAGMTGKAVSFAMPDQAFEVKRIERLTRIAIPRLALPELLEIPQMTHAQRDDREGGGQRFDRKRSGFGGSRPRSGGSYRGGQHTSNDSNGAVGSNDAESGDQEPKKFYSKSEGSFKPRREGGSSFRPRREEGSSYGAAGSGEGRPSRGGFGAKRGGFGGPKREGGRSFAYGRPHSEGGSSFRPRREEGSSYGGAGNSEGRPSRGGFGAKRGGFGGPKREGGRSFGYGRPRTEGGSEGGSAFRPRREPGSASGFGGGSSTGEKRPFRGGFGAKRSGGFGNRDSRPTGGDRRTSRTPRRGAKRPGNASDRFESKW